MPIVPQISFTRAGAPKKGTLIVFCDRDNVLAPSASALDEDGLIKKAIKADDFKGSFGKSLVLMHPAGTDYERVVLMGLGKMKEVDENVWLRLGGKILGALGGTKKAAIMLERPDGQGISSHEAVQVGLGARLGAYRFTKYKSDKQAKRETKVALAIHTDAASLAKSAWPAADAVADGVYLARDCVNEPANTLTPKEFASRAKKLEKVGCKVEVLDEKAMAKLKMNALLGVAQGSRNAPRMAIIRWDGGKKNDKPIAFIGKGVTFDTGGISLKPAGGMEDMKGDMGGAGAVIGLMHALAARKAKANVVGIIACVENMPDGNAQRPGDIVTSMSGQTIEVLNTDAEGRLVLADALWHCREKFDPVFMVNLATLTGAIMVALGQSHAGLFSNNDELAERLTKAGLQTKEKVWRMPLGPEYDKLIDSKTADMKNIGGRYGGSITAAQFLQRFVKETPWAHLDVAGTAMGSEKNEINQSWGSGYGVRLLDRLVANHYES